MCNQTLLGLDKMQMKLFLKISWVYRLIIY